MSPLDDSFRCRTEGVFDCWRRAFEEAPGDAQRKGIVLTNVNTHEAAHALVAQIEGTLSLTRNSQDPDTLTLGAHSLRHYLESMRP
jgi:hypothetical protein